MDYLKTAICDVIANISGSVDFANHALFWVLLVISGLFTLFIGYVANRFITPIILHVVSKTATVLDDYFFNRPVLRALWHVLPALLFYVLLPYCVTPYTTPQALTFITGATGIYITIMFMLLITAFLTNINTFAKEHNRLRSHHLAGVIQFLKIIVYFLGAIAIIAILLGRNPLGLVAGLGAAATVLMFVFKDTVLGLVAGIQLSTNRMLKPGDWVTIEKMGINGIVLQVSLTTVKIRNFDNTISTVPPYTLVSDTFQNWEGMKQRKARRVKRSVWVDFNSIHACTPTEITQFQEAGLVANEEDLQAQTVVNLTLFRHYAEQYLRQRPDVLNTEDWQWLMARQLDPTPQGVPIEFWFYLGETHFVRYENLAAECIEHLIAVAPRFNLKLYQQPGADDVRQALQSIQKGRA